jgi:hypothetical protein
VGGRLFRQYAAEVERRLWRCPAYRALAPPAARRMHPEPSDDSARQGKEETAIIEEEGQIGRLAVHMARRHFGDRRPIVHPEHAPSTAVGYVRIAHLSAPRITSAVKRPAPSGSPLGALDDVADLEGTPAGLPRRPSSPHTRRRLLSGPGSLWRR